MQSCLHLQTSPIKSSETSAAGSESVLFPDSAKKQEASYMYEEDDEDELSSDILQPTQVHFICRAVFVL